MSSESQALLADGSVLDRDANDQSHHEDRSNFEVTRAQTRRFLTSKYGHYSVLLLVSLDVSCIFADFLLGLYICEHTCKKEERVGEDLPKAQNALGVVSLVFSCLFMAELMASLWAFGVQYFRSWFHCFDATVIVAAFIIDVCLKGILEEAGSIVVVLRLWRVFKIVEEFTAGASDQMELLAEKIERLEKNNRELSIEVKTLKYQGHRSGDS